MNPRVYSKITYANTAAPSSYCPEAQAWFDAMTVQLSSTYKSFWNTKILALIANGAWVARDVINIPCMVTEQQSNLNLKNPTSTIGRLTPMNFASTFVSKVGYPCVAANLTYLKTNWIPETHGVKYTLNNAKVSIKLKNNIADDGYAMGVRHNGSTLLRPRRFGDAFDGKVNSSNGVVENTDSTGVHSAITNGTSNILRRNGTVLLTTAAIPSSVPDGQIFLGAWNDGAIGEDAPDLHINGNTIQWYSSGEDDSNDAVIDSMINEWTAL